MLTALCFTVFGYLSGSILFARVYGALFGKDLISNSTDGNPGTSNAFIYGGMLCGTLTLLGDLIKGFLTVFLYLYMTRGNTDIYFMPVLAAPVLGHIFPCFYRFRGGKGIAVSFGCLFRAFANTPTAFNARGNLYNSVGCGSYIAALLQNNTNLLHFYCNYGALCRFLRHYAGLRFNFGVYYTAPLKKPRRKAKIRRFNTGI